MTASVCVLVLGLGLPWILPARVLAGRHVTAVPFLAPLVGAVAAATAVELELLLGGREIAWYAGLAACINGAAVLLAPDAASGGRGRGCLGTGLLCGRAPFLDTLVLAGVMVLPMLALATPLIGVDANTIWITHSLLVNGGHGVLTSGLINQAYQYTNPDYPPLVPAVGALALPDSGTGYLIRPVELTVMLNACALGVLGAGLAATGQGRPRPHRWASLAIGSALCLAGFGVAGDYGVNGYADLLWSAAAVAAMVWGLAVNDAADSRRVAWLCLVVASLTKNEGMTTALVISAVLGWGPWWRSRNFRGPGGRRPGWGPGGGGGRVAAVWSLWAARTTAPLSLAAVWVVLVRRLGIHDAFFTVPSRESIGYRLGATLGAVAGHLGLVFVAGAVALGASWLSKGSPAGDGRFGDLQLRLWLAVLLSLAVMVVTYGWGSLEIRWWLQTSVSRTTIFPQLAACADLALVASALLAEGQPGREASVAPPYAGDRWPAPAAGRTGG